MLTALIEKASAHEELKFIRAVVTNTPANSIDIFVSQGFGKYGVEPRGIKKGNDFFDQTYLGLKLRD